MCLWLSNSGTTPPTVDGRKPTPRKIAYWEAIQEAKGRGLGIKAIARELGISRNTVKKYIRAPSTPVYRRRANPQQEKED